MLGTPQILLLMTALVVACGGSVDSAPPCEADTEWDSESDSGSDWDSDSDSDSGIDCDADTTPPVDCPDRPTFEHPDPYTPRSPVQTETCVDPVVDNPVLVTEGEVESWGSGTDSYTHVEGRCSWPLETCGTWSGPQERSVAGRCLGSATLTGCAADRYVREGEVDVYTQYYAADGSLLAVRSISDTEVGCHDPTDTTAWEAWLGPFVDGCVQTNVRATAGCIPRTLTNVYVAESGQRAGTLDQAIAQVPTGCYGLAVCQDECGPASVIFAAGAWRDEGDALQAAHYDLLGQRIGDGLAIPRSCRNAVLTPSAGCGLVGDTP